jgi:hypothetical protein
LLRCPFYFYHVDVHPRQPFVNDFDVHVEPAGPRC